MIKLKFLFCYTSGTSVFYKFTPTNQHMPAHMCMYSTMGATAYRAAMLRPSMPIVGATPSISTVCTLYVGGKGADFSALFLRLVLIMYLIRALILTASKMYRRLAVLL